MSATIRDYMTAKPVSIGHDRPLAEAHRIMRARGFRHLPVLDGGRLVGILSLRDLHFIETLRDVDPDSVLVEEAMSEDVYKVRPTAKLESVARAMARRKVGTAVVTSGDKVVGMFTTVDALRALAELAAGKRPRKASA